MSAPTTRVLPLDGRGRHSRERIGGKAWSIQRMRSLGIDVPPAFVLTTDVCREYHRNGRILRRGLWTEVVAAMEELGERAGRRFADPARPLLVSVRSGAAASMPGMMDTVLNLGMDDAIVAGLATDTGDPGYAADTRRRFVEQFIKVVGGSPPDDPWEQLRLAVHAVLESWNSRRATAYREARNIPHDGGTAVAVQAMVFGNLDDRSGTGVLFSRNPLTGEPEIYGEWLPRGQGEDVVSGRTNALPLAALADTMPEVYRRLVTAARTLEREGRDVQDIEFTVQAGRLWLLQYRTAKRSAEAALRCAVALRREGVITEAEVLNRVTPDQVRALMTPRLTDAGSPPVASGKPASPGIATGIVVTDADEAEDLAEEGTAVVLARPTTDPDDVAGMSTAVAVLTELGGSTSHAAVVCREIGVPCVVGCGTGSVTRLAGKTVTVDAATGTVHLGELPVEPAVPSDDPDLRALHTWLCVENPAEAKRPVAELLELRRGGRS